ncbi:MAG: M14 family zinc carboxypeptidase [Candidatus Aminicenantaceae bacterium]
MRKCLSTISWLLLFLLFLTCPFYALQKIDEESTKLIREYTTDKKFLNSLIDHIPESDTVPSPRDILGYIVGTPKKLTYYEDIIRYMKALAEASKNVDLIPIGETNLGRMMYIVVIASEDAISNISKYKAYSAALADPRKTPEAEAKEIITQAKPIYFISCNLHSWETGSAEMSMELAYRLAVSEDPFVKVIRNNAIVLITPCAEPDGHDSFTDWYYRYRKDISDERSRFPGPPYWGKYVFHDNNRDIEVSQPLTKNVIKMFLDWNPQAAHDLHESIPYLYISTGTGPYYPSLDPILVSEWHWLAFWEVTELTKRGMPGVWTHAFYTGWYPGYLMWVANLHNAIGRFYETFGNGGATTMERVLKREEEESFQSRFNVTKKEWYRPWPPDKKVTWSIRNNINYQQSGILCGLNLVANNKETILFNFWRKGFNAVERSGSEPPYAWIVPPAKEQDHPVEAANILNLLITQGVEISQAKKEIKVKAGTFPKGSYVVKMNQPYSTYAKTLLEVQKFPETASRPYDDVGWTLGYMHGVKTVRIDDRDVLDIPGILLKEKIRIKGKMEGKKAKYAYIIPHRANNNLITFRFALKDHVFYAAEKTFKAGNIEFPPGSFIIPVDKDNSERQYIAISTAAKELGLNAYSVDKEIDVEKHLINLPRIALYHTWTNTQNSGWIRFAFDQYKIPYATISKDRLRRGNMSSDYDIILIPHQSSYTDTKTIVFGYDPKLGPIPYEKTEEFKYMGVVDQSKDITGGMGYEGLKNLKNFIDKGGIVILLGSSSRLALDFGLVRNISTRITKELRVPGSILKGEAVDNKNPILYGYGKNIPLYHSFGFMFNIPDEEKEHIVLRYAKSDDICMSGYIKGEKEIKGKAAIVSMPVEKGHVVMFNFNPLHRFQTKVNFMLVFNILMNFDDMEM